MIVSFRSRNTVKPEPHVMGTKHSLKICVGVGLLAASATLAAAQPPAASGTPATSVSGTASTAPAIPPGITPPGDYLIGPDDHLVVAFWRDKDLSAEVVVRPDGKISLPLLNDVHAAGLTPEQLRLKVIEEAKRYIEDPNAT